jgi:hypothetical protein
MGEIFAEHKKLAAGDSFTVDWLPDSGALLTVRGKPQATVQGGRLLQRLAAHLARPQPGRLEAQGRAAGQAALNRHALPRPFSARPRSLSPPAFAPTPP